MKIEAKKKYNKYKSDARWLRAAYLKNKEEIDNALKYVGKEQNKYTVFKQLAQDYIKKGKAKNLYSAVKKMERSYSLNFTTQAEIFRENAWKGLRSNKESFKQLRQSIGWKNKIDETKLVYDKKEKAYIYDNRIKIIFEVSPPQIKIYE